MPSRGVSFSQPEPEAPDIESLHGDHEAWRQNSRLSRHAAKYTETLEKSALLKRYLTKAAQNVEGVFDVKLLMRHSCHVGAWVAILSMKEASRVPPGSDLSPVLVLAKLLKLRGRTKLTPWLYGILHLVAHRLREAHATCSDETRRHWSKLKNSMPRNVWKLLRRNQRFTDLDSADHFSALAHVCGFAQEEHADAQMQLADPVVLHTNPSLCSLSAVCEWQKMSMRIMDTCSDEQADEHVTAALKQACAAIRSQDPELMLRAVETCIALLAPPRQQSFCDGFGECMTERAKSDLRAQKQAKLRRIVATLLGLSKGQPGGLDLQDSGTRKLLQVPLSCLKALLIGRDLRKVSASGQWMLLGQALEMVGIKSRAAMRDSSEATHASCRKRAFPEENVEGEDRTTGRGVGTKKGKFKWGLRQIVQQALSCCGGQATVPQLCHVITNNPLLQAQVNKQFPSWQDQLKATFLKKFCRRMRCGAEVKWRLAESTRGVALRTGGAIATVKIQQDGIIWRLVGPTRSSFEEAKQDRQRWDNFRSESNLENVADIVKAGVETLGFQVNSKRTRSCTS